MKQTRSATALLAWGMFCFFKRVDSARLFECVWRFGQGADIGLPAKNLSSSLSTTCLKFLSFGKVWESLKLRESSGHWPTSPTRALKRGQFIEIKRSKLVGKSKHSIKAKEPRPQKVTRTFLVYQQGAFHKPLCVIFRTFMPCLTSVLWSKPGRKQWGLSDLRTL